MGLKAAGLRAKARRSDGGPRARSLARCQSGGTEFAGLGLFGQIGCQLGSPLIGTPSPVSGSSPSSNDTPFSPRCSGRRLADLTFRSFPPVFLVWFSE